MTLRFAAALLAAGLACTTTAPRAATLLFATDTETDRLYSVDPATGSTTEIGPLGSPFVLSIAFAPDGTLYGIDRLRSELLTINTDTGATAVVGSLRNALVLGLTFIGSTLYSTNEGFDRLVTINTTTGAVSEVAPLGSRNVTGLAADASGALFATDTNRDELLSVNPETGVTTVIGSNRGDRPFNDPSLLGLTFAPDGTLFATDRGRRLVTVDPATGALTSVGQFGLTAVRGLAAAPAGFGVVPLPAAGWLLLSGLGALVLVRRRAQPA